MKNLVIIQDNKAITTSLKVAEIFGKKHDNILKSINNIIGNMRDIEDVTDVKNNVSVFSLSVYKDKTGRTLKQYIMNRDGFTLLAMGFTGKKALQFKLAYINAFNQMEATLSKKELVQNNLVEVKEHTRKLPSGKKEIVLSEKARNEVGGIVKAVINKALEERLPNNETSKDIFDDVLLVKNYMTPLEIRQYLNILLENVRKEEKNNKGLIKLRRLLYMMRGLAINYIDVCSHFQIYSEFSSRSEENKQSLISFAKNSIDMPVNLGDF